VYIDRDFVDQSTHNRRRIGSQPVTASSVAVNVVEWVLAVALLCVLFGWTP
jgi:hypothetical protein